MNDIVDTTFYSKDLNREKNTCQLNWKSSTSCIKGDFARMEKEWMNSSLIAYCKVAQKPMLNYSRDLLFTLFLSNDNNNDSSLPKSVVDNSTTRLLTLVEGADDSSSKQLCNKSNEFNNKSEKQVVDDLSRNHKY